MFGADACAVVLQRLRKSERIGNRQMVQQYSFFLFAKGLEDRVGAGNKVLKLDRKVIPLIQALLITVAGCCTRIRCT